MNIILVLINKLKKVTKVEIIHQPTEGHSAIYDPYWNRIFVDPELEADPDMYNYLLLHELSHAFGAIFNTTRRTKHTEEKTNSLAMLFLLQALKYTKKDQIYRCAFGQYAIQVENQKNFITKTIGKHAHVRLDKLIKLLKTPDDQLHKYDEISKNNGYCMYDGRFCHPEKFEEAIRIVSRAMF